MRIFSIILPVRVSGLLISEFLLIFASYLLAMGIIYRGDTYAYLTAESGVLRLLLVSFSLIFGLFVNNLYADAHVASRGMLILKMCNVAGIAFIAQGLLSYISSGVGLSRTVMLLGTTFAFLTLVAWRLFYGTVFLPSMRTHRILFLGNDDLIEEIAARVGRHPELGYAVCGYLEDSPAGPFLTGDSAAGMRLGNIDDLERVVETERPDHIVVGLQDRRERLPVDKLLKLARSGVRIEEASLTFETICGRVSCRELRASQIIFRNELASRPGSLALQSIYANLAGIIGLAVTAPIMILVALAVRLTSSGPILDPDVRVGQYGIPFNLNRFRCHRTVGRSPGDAGERRLTPVGRVLRALHLVHLPRVLNLLRGEITLVGPEPERPEFAEEISKYFAYYRQRYSVKPGLTGWSQINFKRLESTGDTQVRIEYDLYYTKHISPLLDAYILLHGVRQLLPFARH